MLVTLLLGFSFTSRAASAQSSKDPLTLARAVALALESNQLVKAADFGVQAAETRTSCALDLP